MRVDPLYYQVKLKKKSHDNIDNTNNATTRNQVQPDPPAAVLVRTAITPVVPAARLGPNTVLTSKKTFMKSVIVTVRTDFLTSFTVRVECTVCVKCKGAVIEEGKDGGDAEW